jgi:hypothetical protein
VRVSRLVGAVVAFFLAVGVAAHALDELHGRPLGTAIPRRALIMATALSLVGAVIVGAFGVARVGGVLVPFIVAGPLLVVAYNAELFGGVVHTDAGFAAAWGAFPVLTAYVAESSTVRVAPVLAAFGAFALSWAQRALSTPARTVRRRVRAVEGTVTMTDGSTRALDSRTLLAPLERALRALSWGVVTLAAALALARLT